MSKQKTFIQKSITNEMDEIIAELNDNQRRFDLADDPDLIEAIIYEQKSLQSRYAYLLRQAKRAQLSVGFVERLG